MTGVEPTKPRSGRGLKIALGLSLALNLAVIGTVAGALLRDGGPGRMPRELGLGPFTEAFSPKDRQAMRQAFMSHAGEMGGMRAMRDEQRADQQALIAALRATPFDPAAFQAAVNAQGKRITDRIALGQTLMAERILAMTPDERAAFADRLEHMMDHD